MLLVCVKDYFDSCYLDGLSSLLLSAYSKAPILDSIPEEYSSSPVAYADLVASKQFITLLKPNDLLHAKALGSGLDADIIDNIELFFIGRTHSITEREQEPSQKSQKRNLHGT